MACHSPTDRPAAVIFWMLVGGWVFWVAVAIGLAWLLF